MTFLGTTGLPSSVTYWIALRPRREMHAFEAKGFLGTTSLTGEAPRSPDPLRRTVPKK